MHYVLEICHSSIAVVELLSNCLHIVVNSVVFEVIDTIRFKILTYSSQLLSVVIVNSLNDDFGFVELGFEVFFLVVGIIVFELILHKEIMICSIDEKLVLVFFGYFDAVISDSLIDSPRTFSF
jgi:hypothetical protein